MRALLLFFAGSALFAQCSFDPTYIKGQTEGVSGYTQTITAVGADCGRNKFTASGLPAGVSISGAGVITGTPATRGTYNVTINYGTTSAPYVFMVWDPTLTCTPYKKAQVIQGQNTFPAFEDGLEGVVGGIGPSYSQVRMAITASAAINGEIVLFASEADWAANPGAYRGQGSVYYYHTPGDPIVAIASGLNEATKYHVALIASTNQHAYCAPVDETFTTAAYSPYAVPLAQWPAGVDPVNPPSPTGKVRKVGVTTGCKGTGSPGSDFQACLNLSRAGDEILLQPGVTYSTPLTGGPGPGNGSQTFLTPDDPSSYPITSVSGSTLTSAGAMAVMSNGQTVVVDNQADPFNGQGGYQLPKPLTQGLIYKIINKSGNTFQLSSDGVNPVTLTTTGVATSRIAAWPITHDWIIIDTASPANQLPPPGVRADPSYAANYAVLQKAHGTPGASPVNGGTNRGLTDVTPIISFGSLASRYWIRHVKLTSQPGLSLSSQADPPGYAPLVNTFTSNDSIVFDQILDIGAPPPDRGNGNSDIFLSGSNNAVINSFIQPTVFWQPARFIPASTPSGNTLTLNFGSGWAGKYTYVNSSGKMSTCTVGTSPVTLNFTGTGAFYVETTPLPDCNGVAVHLSTGMTGTASGTGATVIFDNPANPGWTVDSHGRAVGFPLGIGTTAAGAVTWQGGILEFGQTTGDSNGRGNGGGDPAENSSTLYLKFNPGPVLFYNDYFTCEGLCLFNDVSTWSILPVSTPFIPTGFTAQKSSFVYDPRFHILGPNWNGGLQWTHTGVIETKEFNTVSIIGNVIGPTYVGAGNGNCSDSQAVSNSTPAGQIPYLHNSNYTFMWNTCLNTVTGVFVENAANGTPGSSRGMNVSQNLFALNGYKGEGEPARPATLWANKTGLGFIIWTTMEEGVTIQNNTSFLNGGFYPHFLFSAVRPLNSVTVLNNLIFQALDNGVTATAYSDANTQFGASQTWPRACGGLSDSLLFACLPRSVMTNNLIVPTWSSSNPSSPVELTRGQITALQKSLPAGNYLAPGSTLAQRTAAVGFLNPPSSLPAWFAAFAGDLRLAPTSAFKNKGTDKLDPGVDWNALLYQQGAVQDVAVSGVPSNTSATVVAKMPAGFVASLDYSTSAAFLTGAGTFSRITPSSTNQTGTYVLATTWTIPTTGMASGSIVTYRVNGQVQQPTGTFRVP